MKLKIPTFSTFVYQMIVIGLVIFIIISQINGCSKRRALEKDKIALVNALNDTLHTVVNKDSSKTSTIAVVQTASPKEFEEIKNLTGENLRLQKLVEEYKNKLKAGSSASVGRVETDVDNVNPTGVWQDTSVVISEALKVYPTYTDSIKNKWIDYKAVMNKDSSTLMLKVYNDFTAVVGMDKGKPFANVTTDNPYSVVKSLRTYQVSMPKPKKWGIGFSTGVTVNSSFKPQAYLGVGVNYNLIRF